MKMPGLAVPCPQAVLGWQWPSAQAEEVMEGLSAGEGIDGVTHRGLWPALVAVSHPNCFHPDPRNTPPVVLKTGMLPPFAIFHVCLFITTILCFTNRDSKTKRKMEKFSFAMDKLGAGVRAAPPDVSAPARLLPQPPEPS